MTKYLVFILNDATGEIERFYTTNDLVDVNEWNQTADDAFKTEIIEQDIDLPKWGFGGGIKSCLVWRYIRSERPLLIFLKMSGV